MVVQRLFDFELDRVLRDNFSYNDNQDYCSFSRGPEWMVTVSFIAVVLGGFTSILYLIVTTRSFNTLVLNFPFLNSFLLACFANLVSNGIFDIMIIRSRCWPGSRLLCKALPTILDGSENAMILFIVALILEQNHPYVHSFLSKNKKFRKRLTVTVLWLVTLVISIPEIISWDTFDFGGGFDCTVPRTHHFQIRLHKGLFLEYIVPLLLLIVTLTHAAAVWRRRSGTPSANQPPDESYSRNDGESERREETDNQCPPIRVTSFALGGVFFGIKTPIYFGQLLYTFFGVRSTFLFRLIFLMYPIPPIIAPIVVIISSSSHKIRLKETYQCIASCFAGRSVEEGSLFSARDEEKL
ncbi:hypothetical protein HOLleu_15660 [Holothuria leucospilota]|uniref:G-protein coupled receptors family 1 profile domain-containing protein n=1 Tax=Holothuria leucospilota TaxID=206669 RepID=A0A9Q1HAK1_HOLLE|nr:hypothetical protein HOLleu_15660 [Holothuria leucospilota]